MNSNLIYTVVVMIFIQKFCQCSPVFTIEVNQEYDSNHLNQNLYQDLRTRSQTNSNLLNILRTESKKKSCGHILLETLPMICQHSANIFINDNNYEYSDSYEDYESQNPKMKRDIIEECCVHKCSFQDLINFCQR